MTRNVNNMTEVVPRRESEEDSVGGNILTVSYVAPEDVAPEDNQRELPKESTEVSSTFSAMPAILEMPSSPNHLLSSRSTSISRPQYQSVSCTPLKHRKKKSIFSDTSSMFSTTGTDSSTNRSRSRQRDRDLAVSYPPISSRKFCRSRPEILNLEANDSYNDNRHVLLSPIKESESFSNQSKLAENEDVMKSSPNDKDLYIHMPNVEATTSNRHRGETPSQSREGRISISISEEGFTSTTTSRSMSTMRYEIRDFSPGSYPKRRHIRRVMPRKKNSAKPPPPPLAAYSSRVSV